MLGTTAVGVRVQASTWTLTSGGTVQEMSTKSTEREDQDWSELEILLEFTTPTGRDKQRQAHYAFQSA